MSRAEWPSGLCVVLAIALAIVPAIVLAIVPATVLAIVLAIVFALVLCRIGHCIATCPGHCTDPRAAEPRRIRSRKPVHCETDFFRTARAAAIPPPSAGGSNS